MTKNIRVHNTFFFIPFFIFLSYTYPATVMVKDLSDTEIVSLRNYLKQYPKGFTIEVKPDQTLMNHILGWGEWVTGTVSIGSEKTIWSSFKPFAQCIFGGTIVSYCATAYVIYRAYHLIKKVGTWTHWLDKENDDEIILYVRRREKEHSLTCLSSIKEEIALLECYVSIHNKLIKMHLRWLFPQNKAYDECIVTRVERLKALERKLQII